jgi:hypothetical protein
MVWSCTRPSPTLSPTSSPGTLSHLSLLFPPADRVSLSTRIRKYHLGVWSIAILFTLFPFIINMYHSIYGFWYVSQHHDESAICWLKVTNINKLGLPLWFLFIMPLLFVYLFCLLTLVVAYIRLQRGLTRSFIPRLRLLVANTANVFVLSLFWSMFFLLYAWTFFTRHQEGSYNATLFDILTFSIGSKGVASLMVWIFVTDANAFGKMGADEETIDANKSLREEVLSFATAGIRSTARAGPTLSADTTLTIRRPIPGPQAAKKSLITPYFFVRFMMGETEEIDAIREMASQKRRSLTASFVRSSMQMSEHAPRETVSNSNASNRLSQRPTVLSQTDGIQKLTSGTQLNIGRESDVEGGGKNPRSVSEVTRASDLMEAPSESIHGPLNETLATKLWALVLRVLDIDQA